MCPEEYAGLNRKIRVTKLTNRNILHAGNNSRINTRNIGREITKNRTNTGLSPTITYSVFLYPFPLLTLILLTCTKWWAPTSASKWRMGFNSAFKRLINPYPVNVYKMVGSCQC
jgi:hypothetical protein